MAESLSGIHARVWAAAPGPTVVLVHGLVVSGRYMIPLAEQLAPRFRVYVPDLPGFGRSEKPRSTLDVAGLADVLVDWIQTADLAPAALLGNSLGCQVIAHAAVSRPDVVERIVLVGPTVDPSARPAARLVARWLVESPRERTMAHVLLADLVDAGLRQAVETFRAMLADRIERTLPRVHVPALVVRGSRDLIVSQGWAEEAARLLPDGRLAVLEGCGHAANYDCPADLAGLVTPFLDGAS